MAKRIPFEPCELEMRGFHQSCIPAPGPPILNSPITAGENLMLALSGQRPMWYPSCGMIGGDYKPFRPARNFPDLWVAHDFMCGDEPVDWDSVPKVQEGWFGVQWEYVDVAGGCMPVPGTQMIDDMNDWEKLPWPNLDDIDWEGCAEANKEYLDSDIPVEFCIPTLMWERLMSILEVEDAAVALIDEDQEEALRAFMEKLTDFYIDYVRRVKKYFNPAMILTHDDWGHQRGQFFSNDVHDEFILPYFKRLVDEVHALGMKFELHCCGKAEGFAEEMVEAGVDIWIPQEMNDTKALAEKYRDKGIVFGVYLPPITPETTDEEMKAIANDFAATYGDLPVAFVDYSRNPQLYKYMYEAGRKAYA